MQEEVNPYQLFEKQRIKVTQIQKMRREDIFNQSRNLIDFGVGNEEKEEDESENNLGMKQLSLALEPQKIFDETKDISSNVNNQDKKKKKGGDKRFYKMFQIPSWMILVPQQFQNFYGMARPNGKSCILAIKNNKIQIYDKFARRSSLPALSSRQAKASHLYNGTILQCTVVQHENSSKIIYITDCIQWKQNLMTAENFEFRYGWLMSNFGHLSKLQSQFLQFRQVEYLLMDNLKNLENIYKGQCGYDRQGLGFIHRQSPYLHGFNENVLIWKDYQTSKYPIDGYGEDMNEGVSENIYGTGKLTKNGVVLSLDGHKFGTINSASFSSFNGGFIRFRTKGISFINSTMQAQNSKQQVQLIDFVALKNKKFGRADPLSRLVFQHRMRYDQLKIKQISSRIPQH